jgi:hypothetical protein
MAISTAQQGAITEAEFVKIAILSSNGALVPARPIADDERRDFEVHIRHHFRETLAVQVKTARRLRAHGRSRRLQIEFQMKRPVVVDARLWFLLAHFDIRAMGLDDPLFFVPSEFLVHNARHGLAHGAEKFQIQASMELTARDKWTPYQVLKADLGSRILEILGKLPTRTSPSQPPPDLLALRSVIWVPAQPAALQGARRRAA